jgi:maltose O-acetyltransferase
VSRLETIPLPRPLEAYRRRVMRRLHRTPDIERLRANGLRIGRDVFIGGGTFLDPDFCFLIEIGDETTISIDVFILAHDASTRREIGFSRVAPVRIGSGVFVGARAMILPGITIGDGAVVAAASVVTRDVAPGDIVAGNPARPLARTDAYLETHRRRLAERPNWEREGHTNATGITPENRDAMRRALDGGEAYIR